MPGEKKQGLRSEDEDLETEDGLSERREKWRKSKLLRALQAAPSILHYSDPPAPNPTPQAMDRGGLGWAPHGCNSNLCLLPPWAMPRQSSALPFPNSWAPPPQFIERPITTQPNEDSVARATRRLKRKQYDRDCGRGRKNLTT
jgi:hypothetical protein